MHSTPSPMLESSICCLGERNLGESPVPIINKSTESLIIRGNKNSFPISVMSIFDNSLDELAETKQGLDNLMCESDTEESSIEIMVFVFAFCWVNSINLYAYLIVGTTL